MKRLIVSALVLVSLCTASIAPAMAGGWATARLDEQPGEIGVGEPWRFGFMVRAHDISPVNVGVAEIFAHHRNGQFTLSATATQEGAEGHYVGELTFPEAGEWKWGASAEPYGQMPFETLVVGRPDQQSLASAPKPVLNLKSAEVHLVEGDCAGMTVPSPESTVGVGVVLDRQPADAVPPEKLLTNAAVPVWRGDGHTTSSLEELNGGEFSLTVVTGNEGDRRPVACGAARGTVMGNEMVVGLTEQSASGQAGVALLASDNDGTSIEVYLVPTASRPPVGGAALAGSDVPEIVISDAGFSPSLLSVPAGATVRWRNAGAVVHSVVGGDLAFSDSALIEPGDAYNQRFDLPGTYTYRCGPHQSMIGTIEVT